MTLLTYPGPYREVILLDGTRCPRGVPVDVADDWAPSLRAQGWTDPNDDEVGELEGDGTGTALPDLPADASLDGVELPVDGPVHVGGGVYQLPDGRRVRGAAAARAAMTEMSIDPTDHEETNDG